MIVKAKFVEPLMDVVHTTDLERYFEKDLKVALDEVLKGVASFHARMSHCRWVARRLGFHFAQQGGIPHPLRWCRGGESSVAIQCN